MTAFALLGHDKHEKGGDYLHDGRSNGFTCEDAVKVRGSEIDINSCTRKHSVRFRAAIFPNSCDCARVKRILVTCDETEHHRMDASETLRHES